MQAGPWGSLGFFVGAFLEEVVFPLPSPLLLIGIAFFFGKPVSALIIGKMLLTVVLPITLGATLGSLVIYAVAYSGGRPLVMKYSRLFKFSWDDVEKMRTKLMAKKSDELAIFISRCIPYMPTALVTVAAGVMRINVWRFSIVTFVGIFVRVAGLFFGGIIFGGAIFK